MTRSGLALLVAACIGSGAPMTQILPSPDKRIMISPVTQAGQVASAIFNGAAAPLQPVSFLLSNLDAQPVVAVLVTWTRTDTFGAHVERSACESFLDARFPPVLRPGDSMLVLPSLWVPQSNAAAYAQKPSFQSSAASAAQRYSTAGTVTVQIDSVVFASGEVVGPDALGLPAEMVARKKAADSVVALVEGARASGMPVSDALAPVLQSHPRPTDPFPAWQKRYARQIVRDKGDAFLTYLRKLPAVPVLFRTAPK